MWGLHWRPKVVHACATNKLMACWRLLGDASVHRLITRILLLSLGVVGPAPLSSACKLKYLCTMFLLL